MSRFKKLSHTIYECKYHVVFCPSQTGFVIPDERSCKDYMEMYQSIVNNRYTIYVVKRIY